MSAPDFQTLFQIESRFETSFKSILEGALADVNVYISRETLIFETPCVEIKVINGDVNNRHQFQPNPAKPDLYDSWDASLEIRVKTNRGTNGTLHVGILGKTRAALTLFSLYTSFPTTIGALYHSITDIREQRGDSDFDDLTNVDTTIMPMFLLVNIRPDAYPSGI